MLAAAKHPAAKEPKKPLSVVAGEALESGDHMGGEAFMRLYERSPHIKKAELIQGVVYVASPVRADVHGQFDGLLQAWLGAYWEGHPELRLYPNTTLRLGKNMIYQPDGMLAAAPSPSGPLTMGEDGYLTGAPGLVYEIAASSQKIDLHRKKAGYLKAKVPEYLVWRTQDQAIDWFSLQGHAYARLMPDTHGVLQSQVYPGLALDVPAAMRFDLPAMLATLRHAMAQARR